MNRTEKKQLVEYLNGELGGAQIVLVVHNKGLTVAQMTDLRVQVRKAGAKLKVAKNLLTKISVKGTQYEGIADVFKGPTMIAYANDPVAAAKVMSDFAGKNDKLELVAGSFGTQRLDSKAIQALAKLPSLDELRAKIIALLQTPATRIATVLQAPAGQLARVTGAYARKS